MPRHWDKSLPGDVYWSDELSEARLADTFVHHVDDNALTDDDLRQYGPSSVARYYPLSWWGPRGIVEPSEDAGA